MWWHRWPTCQFVLAYSCLDSLAHETTPERFDGECHDTGVNDRVEAAGSQPSNETADASVGRDHG